jgi:hypothetical protein
VADLKADRFKRLAEKRVNRAMKDLRLVGNLANRNNYDYTSDQVAKIISALTRELRDLRGKFENKASGNDTLFTL